MGYISQENLIPTMTPEQKIMVSNFYSKFDNNSAAHKKIVNVEYISLCGVNFLPPVDELTTYSINKMYICLAIELTASAPYAATPTLSFKNELNASFYTPNNFTGFFDGLSLLLMPSLLTLKNFWFSCYTSTHFDNCNFIGYRITLN